MELKNIFNSSEAQGSLGNRFRERRFAFLRDKFSLLPKPLKILDVGGTLSFWVNRGFDKEPGFDITLLNMTQSESQHPNIKFVVGDATNLSQYANHSFDIAFSNSVIEHLFTWEGQVKMANEMMRTGKYYYVQTPNKYFFMEPHYLLPYFQFLPKKTQFLILTKTKLSRMKKWNPERAKNYINEIKLLSKEEMTALFPGSKIFVEHFLGLDKSFSAHNFPDQ